MEVCLLELMCDAVFWQLQVTDQQKLWTASLISCKCFALLKSIRIVTCNKKKNNFKNYSVEQM